MPSIVSPNGFWKIESVSFRSDDESLSDDDRAEQADLRRLASQTEEQRVIDRLKGVEERARRVLAEQGYPCEPGVYFEPHSGPPILLSPSFEEPVPPDYFVMQDSGEGTIVVSPNFSTIIRLSTADHARTVLNLVRNLQQELKNSGDRSRISRLFLDLLDCYHFLVTENSELGKSALLGLKTDRARQLIAQRKTSDRKKRVSIVEQAGREYRNRPGKRLATAHEIAHADGVLEDVISRIAKAGLGETIRPGTVEKMLKEQGF